MEQRNIRNFVIISHVDHGKSTLADRFLELTKTIPKKKMRPQYLDAMDLEKKKEALPLKCIQSEWNTKDIF